MLLDSKSLPSNYYLKLASLVISVTVLFACVTRDGESETFGDADFPVKNTQSTSELCVFCDTAALRAGFHHWHDLPSQDITGRPYFVVEIPAGSSEKWEVDKESGDLACNRVEGKRRRVEYLAYPFNYGMIPQTLLPEELGGDGDPLDVILLGDALRRGSVVPVRFIGMLEMLDRGEQDDKIIAVEADGRIGKVRDLLELESLFPGSRIIVEVWMDNYKGPDSPIQIIGWAGPEEAHAIYDRAVEAYLLAYPPDSQERALK